MKYGTNLVTGDGHLNDLSTIATSLGSGHPFRYLRDSIALGVYLTLECHLFPVVSFSTLHYILIGRVPIPTVVQGHES